MDPVDLLQRELSGKRPRESVERTRKVRQRSLEPKQRAPLASERSSEVAQRWVDAAIARDMTMPFNANWLAHQIAVKVVKDSRLRPLLQNGDHDKVVVWLNKMTDKFWEEYVDESISAKDVSSFYLQEAWDDVRDYAYDCLRAAYLKAHGKRVITPDYGDHKDDPLHTALQKMRIDRAVEEALSTEKLENRDLRKLDPNHVAVLRSRQTKT